MARIRTIKPKFFDDVKVGRISRDARLLYIGLWVFSDDIGVVVGDTVWLKSKIFPYDQIQVQQFEKWMNELVINGFICLLSYNGERFIYLPNFTRHQVINKPNTSDLNISKELIDKEQEHIHVSITEQSGSTTVSFTERSGIIIGKGRGGNIPPSNPPNGGSAGLEELTRKQKELEAKEAELRAKEQELLKLEAALKAKKRAELPKIDFVSPEYAEAFTTWLDYKRERRESYKSDKSLRAAYGKLLQLSENDPQKATAIIEQSMANNWAGLFELEKERRNGNQNRNPYPSKQEANDYALHALQERMEQRRSGLQDELPKPF